MRRNVILATVAISIFLAMSFVAFPNGAAALLIVLVLSLAFLGIFRHYSDDKDFITNIFLIGLVLRLGFGIVVHIFDLREFFGGDANTYDSHGYLLLQTWLNPGITIDPYTQEMFLSTTSPGWGMNYVVALIYGLVGRNIFAAQSFCGVIGAATAPMVYFC